MVITSNDFEVALGGILTKTSETSIKTVIGIFDKDKTVSQNIVQLKRSSGADLQQTISFLKQTCTEYPVAQHVLSCKNTNKEIYSRDIAKFLDFVKPTQCLACKDNYIPAAEQCTGTEPKCYLCQRPSHGPCYQDTDINPEVGVIFLCSECISVKVANELAENLQKQPDAENLQKQPDAATDSDSNQIDKDKSAPTEKPNEETTVNNGNKEEITYNHQQDCPQYLKRICPHGLTGRRLINGKPCPFKHRKLCTFYTQYGPSGCRYKNNCRYLHPDICQNSLKLKMCLNRSCQELHIRGTQRHARPSQDEDNNAPPQRADTRGSNKRNQISPWTNPRQQAETRSENQQTRQDSTEKETTSFLDKYFSEMKESLEKRILESIQSNRPQLVMMQPQTQSLNAQNQNLVSQPATNIQPPHQQDGAIQNQTQPSMFNLLQYALQYPNLPQPAKKV